MTDDPNDFDAIILQAEERHRHDMSVLREAAEIAKRLRGQHQAAAGATKSITPTKPPIIVKRHVPSNHKGASGNDQKPEIKPIAIGLTEMVREAISASEANFTIRTLAKYIVARKPDLAKSVHFMVGISSALSRELNRKKIELVARGSAGKPSVYRNAPPETGPLFN